MVCGNCGNDLREGARFCPACGTPAAVPDDEVTVPSGKALPPLPPAPDPVDLASAPAKGRSTAGSPSTRWILAGGAALVLVLLTVLVVVASSGGDGEAGAPTTTTERPGPTIAPATTVPAGGQERSTPTSAPAAPVNREEEARQEIERLVADGEQRVGSGMLDRWIPQISSKQVGLAADGIVYDNQAILDHFTQLRQRFGDLIVVNSSDFSTFELDGWYVALAPQSFGTSQEALGWCASNGMPTRNECFAKLVSRTTPYSPGTTDYP